MQPSMPAAVFVALDLSRTSWVVAVRTSGDDRVGTHKLRPGDVDRLLDLIERARGAGGAEVRLLPYSLARHWAEVISAPAALIR